MTRATLEEQYLIFFIFFGKNIFFRMMGGVLSPKSTQRFHFFVQMSYPTVGVHSMSP